MRSALVLTFGLMLLPVGCAPTQGGAPKVMASPHPATPAPRVWTLADLRLPETPLPAAGPGERPPPPPTGAMARAAVQAANREGLDLPTPTCFTGKTCTYWYHPDKQFRVYMAQDNQTLACLKPGERVLNVVAPGEQVWLPHAVYGYGPEGARTECVAFMPRRAGLKHQVSIFTDRRKYDLDVQTWTQTHHVEVRWKYPEDVLAALNGGAAPSEAVGVGVRAGGAEAAVQRPTAIGPGLMRQSRSVLRHCAYALSGDTPPWHPVPTADGQPPVCDDGAVTVIHLPGGALGGQGMPAVWRLDDRGDALPVQAQRIGDTLQVAGVFPRLLLGLEGASVHITRRQ
ncbi:MAG: hypothetical protein RLY86_4361, partial [Pseudomonadota bacterium]|jgi:type IV secretion system protein VirB9